MKSKSLLYNLKIICFVLLLMVFTACTPAVLELAAGPDGVLSQEQIDAIAQEEIYIDDSATEWALERDAKNLEGLVGQSEIIAEVKVMETESIAINEYHVNTLFRAEIITAIRGDIKPGDSIVVSQGGGTFSEGGELIIGYPVVKGGEHNIYFLETLLKSTDDDIPEDYLRIMEKVGVDTVFYDAGLYQGRFVVRDDYVFQQSMEGFKFEDYQPVKLGEFTSDVAAIVKEQAAQ